MKTSEQINEISAALSKALAVITNPTKDATNPHFRSKYATLDTGLNVIREALSKVGISFVQTTRIEGEMLMLDSRIMFGNQWIESEYPVIKFPAKQQEIGSALTYARRYSLFALVGVAGEEDDDANAAVSPAAAPARNVKPAKLPKDESQKIYGALAETLMMAESVEQIDKWLSDNMKAIEPLQDDHKALLRKSVKDIRNEMMKVAA